MLFLVCPPGRLRRQGKMQAVLLSTRKSAPVFLAAQYDLKHRWRRIDSAKQVSNMNHPSLESMQLNARQMLEESPARFFACKNRTNPGGGGMVREWLMGFWARILCRLSRFMRMPCVELGCNAAEIETGSLATPARPMLVKSRTPVKHQNRRPPSASRCEFRVNKYVGGKVDRRTK